jgi:hypothetical protein
MVSVSRDDLAGLINTWSKDAWIEKKRKLADCVWLDGAILDHPDKTRIYIAPEPARIGLVYEVLLVDVVEVVKANITKEYLDQSYIISRIYLTKSAALARIEWMTAANIPGDVAALHALLDTCSQDYSGSSHVDLARKVSLFGEIGPEPSPSPSPEPKEPKQPTVPVVTGIRG